MKAYSHDLFEGVFWREDDDSNGINHASPIHGDEEEELGIALIFGSHIIGIAPGWGHRASTALKTSVVISLVMCSQENEDHVIHIFSQSLANHEKTSQEDRCTRIESETHFFACL